MKHLVLSLLASALLLSCDDSSSTSPAPLGGQEQLRQERIGLWAKDSTIDTSVAFGTLSARLRLGLRFSLDMRSDNSFRILATDTFGIWDGQNWNGTALLPNDTLVQMDGVWSVLDSAIQLEFRGCLAVDSPFIATPMTGALPFRAIECPEPQIIDGPVVNGTWLVEMPSPLGEDPLVLVLEKRAR